VAANESRAFAVAVTLVLGAVVALGPASRPAADAQSCHGLDAPPVAEIHRAAPAPLVWAGQERNGRICERRASNAVGSGCERPGRTITVRLSRRKYPEATLHFEVAWREGAPTRYTIARGRADENRDAWEPLVPAGVDADGDGKQDDRDEVPMAFTKEGGRKAPNGRSASNIAYVDAKDNRGAGSSIGGRLRKYCNGTRFNVKPFGRRARTAVIVVALRNGKRVMQVVRQR
jgi:hypothetical protein